MTKRVFVAGEGKTELGRWASVQTRDSDQPDGVIAALLGKIEGRDWEIVDACLWKHIKKFKPGAFRSAEERIVKGVALRAKESRCDVLAFARDSDGDDERIAKVEKALGEMPAGLAVVGACAHPVIEAWVLIFAGEAGAEKMSKAKVLRAAEARAFTTSSMAGAIEEGDVAAVPAGSHLRLWLDRADAAL